jgi:hypothetical protein
VAKAESFRLGAAKVEALLAKRQDITLGRAVQADSIKTRVESAYAFRA